jgi:hypothetical protein
MRRRTRDFEECVGLDEEAEEELRVWFREGCCNEFLEDVRRGVVRQRGGE